MNKREIYEQFAKQSGVTWTGLRSKRIHEVYCYPDNHPSNISTAVILGPRYTRVSETDEEGCVLSIRYARYYIGTETKFYLNSAAEAYALLTAISFFPDKVYCEECDNAGFHKMDKDSFFTPRGRFWKRKSVTECFLFWPDLIGDLFESIVILIRTLIYPILSFFDYIFRKEEFVYEFRNEMFVLTRRKCSGKWGKKSARRPWMVIENV